MHCELEIMITLCDIIRAPVARGRSAHALCAYVHTDLIGSGSVGPVNWQLAGGVLSVVASTPSAGCDVLCVQVLGGHPPGDWAREGAFLCT